MPTYLPHGYVLSTQAEYIYGGKLLACYKRLLAAHAECALPTAAEAQRIALLVAVAESFPFKTKLLQVSPSPPLLEPAEGELSPYQWLCLAVAHSALNLSKPDLALAARKAERLLRRLPAVPLQAEMRL